MDDPEAGSAATDLKSHILGHGGNLESAAALYPDAPGPWIDLSTGINPVAYPIGDLPPEAWTRLPGRAALQALKAAAAAAYGADGPGRVAAAPGTQALIQILPRLVAPRRVAVIEPTYGEHAAAWRAHGAEVVAAPDLDAALAAGADVVVAVNPNNPDGRVLPVDALLQARAALVRRGGLMVVDEAFTDGFDGLSLVPHLKTDAAGAVVLRSFGKTYGLAGVRLGFAVTDEATAARIEGLLGPWAVPGPAIAIGRRALADGAWLRAAMTRLRADAGRLDGLLADASLAPLGGTPLFRLAGTDDAWPVFDRLARAGILTRPFAYRPGWLRFGLPADAAAWDRLQTALGSGSRRWSR